VVGGERGREREREAATLTINELNDWKRRLLRQLPSREVSASALGEREEKRRGKRRRGF